MSFTDGNPDNDARGGIIKAINICPATPADDGKAIVWSDALKKWILSVAGGNMIKTANTKNLQKSRITAAQVIKSLGFTDVTNIASIHVKLGQTVLLWSFINKVTGGTYQYQLVGVTSGHVYLVSPVLSNTAAAIRVDDFVNTFQEEDIKLQALSSEAVNGVNFAINTHLGCGAFFIRFTTAVQPITIFTLFQATSIDWVIIGLDALWPVVLPG